MGKDHLKRIASPRTWPIMRKANVFVARPQAGKQFDLSLPLGFVLKEVLGICEDTKQVKALLLSATVKVDGAVRKGHRYPIGLYDTIQVGDKAAYRVVFGQDGKLHVIAIDVKEATTKLLRIEKKAIVKGHKLQLGFLNGRILRLDDTKVAYKVGDSVTLDKDGKIDKHLSFKEGALVQFIGGRHTGIIGSIVSIDAQKIVVDVDGKHIETLKKYAFVVGDKTPIVAIQND